MILARQVGVLACGIEPCDVQHEMPKAAAAPCGEFAVGWAQDLGLGGYSSDSGITRTIATNERMRTAGNILSLFRHFETACCIDKPPILNLFQSESVWASQWVWQLTMNAPLPGAENDGAALMAATKSSMYRSITTIWVPLHSSGFPAHAVHGPVHLVPAGLSLQFAGTYPASAHSGRALDCCGATPGTRGQAMWCRCSRFAKR